MPDIAYMKFPFPLHLRMTSDCLFMMKQGLEPHTVDVEREYVRGGTRYLIRYSWTRTQNPNIRAEYLVAGQDVACLGYTLQYNKPAFRPDAKTLKFHFATHDDIEAWLDRETAEAQVLYDYLDGP